MAELSVPKQFLQGFEKLKRLDEASLATLLAVLRSEQPALFREDFAEKAASRLPSVSAADAKEIIGTLLGFYWGRESAGLSTSDFVDALVAQHFAAGDARADLMKRYLREFLGTESLIVTSKAFDVLTEHEHTVHDLRIITDLRPIFKESSLEEPVSAPAAAVITHTLKISYHRGREVAEFFLALDDQDIGLLKQLFERAAAKEDSLKRLLEQSGIPCLET